MHLHKLSVGAGDKISVGWVCNDIQELPGIQLVSDCRELKLPDKSCVLVQAEHILEHLEEPRAALWEWRRVLADDGMLILAMPDLEIIIHLWKAGSVDWASVVAGAFGSLDPTPEALETFREILGDWPSLAKDWEAFMAKIYSLPRVDVHNPNAHVWGFCKRYLRALLEECGYYHIRLWNDHTALAGFALRRPKWSTRLQL